MSQSIVIPFDRAQAAMRRPGPGPGRQLSMADRIALDRWSRRAALARPRRVARVVAHDPEPEDADFVRGFVLIYLEGDEWARWGVGVADHAYEAWETSTWTGFGHFPSLSDALMSLPVALPLG